MKRLKPLTHAQTRLLRAVMDHPGASQKALSQFAGVSQPVVTHALRMFFDTGLVRHVVTPRGKLVEYALTAQGQRIRTTHENFYAALGEVSR